MLKKYWKDSMSATIIYTTFYTIGCLFFLAWLLYLISKNIDILDDISWLACYKLLNCKTYDQISNTTWDLNEFILFHTDGLNQIALSGIVDRLN